MLMNGRNNSNLSIDVNIDGHTSKSTPDLKLLGITLNDKLKYEKHISDICKLASKKVGVLVRLRKIIPTQKPNSEFTKRQFYLISHIVIQCGISAKRLSPENWKGYKSGHCVQCMTIRPQSMRNC